VLTARALRSAARSTRWSDPTPLGKVTCARANGIFIANFEQPALVGGAKRMPTDQELHRTERLFKLVSELQAKTDELGQLRTTLRDEFSDEPYKPIVEAALANHQFDGPRVISEINGTSAKSTEQRKKSKPNLIQQGPSWILV